jgi:hypothetical protein
VRRTAVLAAAALAMSLAVLCGGCRDQATSPDSDTSQFDQVDSTLASIEADVNQP